MFCGCGMGFFWRKKRGAEVGTSLDDSGPPRVIEKKNYSAILDDLFEKPLPNQRMSNNAVTAEGKSFTKALIEDTI
jgi:hypothetical protein